MMNFAQLENKVNEIDRMVLELEQRSQEFRSSLIGGGVIENQGNRVKLDISAALSEFAKKTDFPTIAAATDLAKYIRGNGPAGVVPMFSGVRRIRPSILKILEGILYVNGGVSVSENVAVGGDAVIGGDAAIEGLIAALTAHFGGDASYTAFDATGHQTMYTNARPWRDELGDVLTLKQLGTGLSTNATEASVDFNTAANLSDYLYKNVQLNHDKDLVSSVYPHIHFWQAQNNIPNFLFQYRWQVDGGSKTTAWTNLAANNVAFTYSSGTLNQIAYATAITVPAGTTLSDIIQFRILRDNSNASGVFAGADPYTATVGLMSFDLHFQLNSLGSTDQFTK